MKNITLDTTHLKKLPNSFYTFVEPTPLLNPKLGSVNKKLLNSLEIDDKQINQNNFIEFINGSFLANGSKTYANAYAGHQFGYHVPNLGDGRAINLGSLNDTHFQLKGSGKTPYSRDGDGRAVLRSSIREYLMSEAMAGLNIPTTRAAALITSDTKVYRHYDVENAAIVLRTSPSWIRFGSFEFAYMGKNKVQNLKSLADFVIDESYCELKGLDNRYDELYFKIVDKTIELMALWQSVGFMHGVMNTDNMSVAGLTIDYGPYAFMEEFDKTTICNLSDNEGRYSFENQPFIAQWNLLVLAKVMSPITNHQLCENYANLFIGKFKKRYFEIMLEKLGLYEKVENDNQIVLNLFKAMQKDSIDYTNFFYSLSCGQEYFQGEHISSWVKNYKIRLELEVISKEERLSNMKKINPKYILRNYMLQEAIELANGGDFSLVDDLLKIAQNPYEEHKSFDRYAQATPKELTNMMCSCSS
ncbi:MAG: YdiU family protein [Campylobacterota bacterium]|nr:YdiU family protein [Campylobacterota bacterium]